MPLAHLCNSFNWVLKHMQVNRLINGHNSFLVILRITQNMPDDNSPAFLAPCFPVHSCLTCYNSQVCLRARLFFPPGPF